MRINGTSKCKPSRIRNAGDACLAIIIFYIFQKPVDRIPGIRTLIHSPFLTSDGSVADEFEMCLRFYIARGYPGKQKYILPWPWYNKEIYQNREIT